MAVVRLKLSLYLKQTTLTKLWESQKCARGYSVVNGLDNSVTCIGVSHLYHGYLLCITLVQLYNYVFPQGILEDHSSSHQIQLFTLVLSI